jgi:bifunctional UDP-N-acetylglucosamine pyrophosphorylase/glucosamine-1-phosphate N-acetyltransferase
MNSRKQKILHEVGGEPMVAHVYAAANAIADLAPVVVVGPGADEVRELLGSRSAYVVQSEQLGTGHATLMAKTLLEDRSDQVLVVYADMPLLRPETMAQLAQKQSESEAAVVLLTVEGDPSSTFGRIVRGPDGEVSEIVEVAEAALRPDEDAILAITEQNAGVYCFDARWLWRYLAELPIHQARSGPEYYLTDMIGLAFEQGRHIEAFVVDDAAECMGAGTRAELVNVEKAFRRRANDYWLANGVTLVDPDTIFIDQGVYIGQDTIIWPNTYIQGKTKVGEECILGPNAIIRNSQIGARCQIEQAIVEDTTLDNDSVVASYNVVQKK